jgi:hypothetical protein
MRGWDMSPIPGFPQRAIIGTGIYTQSLQDLTKEFPQIHHLADRLKFYKTLGVPSITDSFQANWSWVYRTETSCLVRVSCGMVEKGRRSIEEIK